MTDDEKREVLARARATVEQGRRRPLSRDDDDAPKKRWNELNEHIQSEPDSSREPEAVLTCRRAVEHDCAWNEWLDTRLDQRMGDERETVLEIVAQALALALEDETRDFKKVLQREVTALRTEIAELSTVVSELRQVIASERARVLDLPPLPLARRVN
jgi:hypothetical protein